MYMVVMDLNEGYSLNQIPLTEGANLIKPGKKGLIYITYHTSDPTAKPVKVHIATGTVNGYYDLTKHS